MQIQTASDPQANLSRYKTYEWAPSRANVEGRPANILDQTLKSAVEKELAAKGLKPAQDSPPDLLVSYFAAAREATNYAPEFGYPSYPYYGTAYVNREGSLTIQFIDPETKRIVWQGTASDTIGEAGASPEQVITAVNELFERYPPTG